MKSKKRSFHDVLYSSIKTTKRITKVLSEKKTENQQQLDDLVEQEAGYLTLLLTELEQAKDTLKKPIQQSEQIASVPRSKLTLDTIELLKNTCMTLKKNGWDAFYDTSHIDNYISVCSEHLTRWKEKVVKHPSILLYIEGYDILISTHTTIETIRTQLTDQQKRFTRFLEVYKTPWRYLLGCDELLADYTDQGRLLQEKLKNGKKPTQTLFEQSASPSYVRSARRKSRMLISGLAASTLILGMTLGHYHTSIVEYGVEALQKAYNIVYDK